MHCTKPFPGQAEQMFKDKFCKWPKLMRAMVLISLIPPSVILVMVHNQFVPSAGIKDIMTITAAFNLLLLFWGLLLKIRSRKYWYRNYHIGKTMALAMLPLIAACYVMLANNDIADIASQQEAKTVYLSLNQ